MTDISIVILNYNTKDLLAQTLDSINRDYSPLVVETIVTDNGSVDGSLEMIKKNYPWVKLIENGDNLGFSAGNNKGIKNSNGEYVLFLNSDVKVIDNAISYVHSKMKENSHVGIGTCYVELSSGEIDPACHRGFPTPWRAFCYYSGIEKIVSNFPNFGIGSFLRNVFGGYHLLGERLDLEHEIDAGIGAFMMVRRVDGDRIGWWDETFFMYGEDLDFCYQIKKMGKKIMYYPESKIIHYKHQSGLKKSTKSSDDVKTIRRRTTAAFYDAMKIFYNKHYLTVYPLWLTKSVLWFVDIKKKRALERI